MRIESQCPTRISLYGGGTDVGPYAEKYGGLCINLAINLRQHMHVYTGDDTFEANGKNTFPVFANPNFYYTIFKEMGIDGGHAVKLRSEFDGVIESGLGSSASAAVALIAALARAKDIRMTRNEIAEKAWDIEVNKMGLFGGKQDQYCAALGGINVMEFGKEVKVTPLRSDFLDGVLPGMVLLYSGSNRKDIKIQEGLKELTPEKILILDNIKGLALRAIEPLGRGDIPQVGYLLDEAWNLKKKSNKVSTSKIDALYSRAKSFGAYGGKILGSGGGGYMLFVVEPSTRAAFIEGMGLEEVDFSIDFNGVESRIIKK